jgi:hypothetical protein
MEHDEMLRLLRQKPFVPFRVFVRDGRLYDVRHPRMNMLQQTYIKIGIPAPDLTPPICDHTEYVRLEHITRVEMLPAEMSLVDSSEGAADALGRNDMPAKKKSLYLPVVSAGAEFLVMGNLMRRNILTYKAPPNYEGYDLICIHPEPRHQPTDGEVDKVLVQVKSRYATDCNRAVLVKKDSLEAFDFLIVAFLNIGKFFGKNDGMTGQREPEFYTLSRAFVQTHLVDVDSAWPKLKLKSLQDQIEPFGGEDGFELIARMLGIPKPRKDRLLE